MRGQQHEELPCAPGAPAPPAAGSEVAALRRELNRLRWEVDALRERVQHLDGELGFAMLTAGRLRGRLDREVAAREALEQLLGSDAAGGATVIALPEQPAGPGQWSSRSLSAACRSGTRSFLTEVDT